MYAVISDLARHSGNYLHGMYKSRDDALLKAYEIGDHCWVIDVRHRDLTERPPTR